MRRHFSQVVFALVLATVTGCGSSSPLPGPSSQVDQQRVMTGIVRESGTHTPISNGRVCWVYPNCVSVTPDGAYRIVHSGPMGNCPYVSGEDHEGRQDCVVLAFPETIWNPTVQRIVRIEAGQAIALTIFSDDISGLPMEDYCVACKRIRITAARAGKLTVRLTPENAGLGLVFAYTEQRANAPFQVQAGQESPVTVITLESNAPRSFELSTTFVPD